MENEVVIPIAENITGTYISSLGQYVSSIVGVFILIAAVAAFIFLVWGGLEWILAGGDKGKIESARNRITGALVGLAIVAASWAIFLLVDYFFGLGVAGGTESSTNTSGGSGGSSSGIGFNCMTQAQCNAYCPNSDYYTVRNSNQDCGPNNVACACVNRTNPVVNPCPTGMTCQ